MEKRDGHDEKGESPFCIEGTLDPVHDPYPQRKDQLEWGSVQTSQNHGTLQIMVDQLLPAGKTTPAPRTVIDIRTPDGSGTLLTLGDAIETYDVSKTTLKRRLAQGRIPGAHKVPGPRGEEWRIPVVALDAMWKRTGNEEKAEKEDPHTPVGPSAEDLSDLVSLIARLSEDLRTEREHRRLELVSGNEERERRILETAEERKRTQEALAKNTQLETRLESELRHASELLEISRKHNKELENRVRTIEDASMEIRSVLTARQFRKLKRRQRVMNQDHTEGTKET